MGTEGARFGKRGRSTTDSDTVAEHVENQIDVQPHEYAPSSLWGYIRLLGPGLVSGASDDDPSCLGTLAQTGASFGYGQLWTVPLAYPLMGMVQEICARIGLQTGIGLAAILRKHYPRPILYLCLVLIAVANVITLAADLGAMAAAAQLLVGIPALVWLIAIPLLSLILQIFMRYKHYVGILRILTLSLLAYVVVIFVTPQDWSSVVRNSLVPTLVLDRRFLMNLVAIFGSAVSPYLFFWQISQQVEKKIDQGHVREHKEDGVIRHVALKGVSPRGVKHMRLDVASGMIFSGLVAWAVIATAASTMHAHGTFSVDSAATAAEALRPVAGDLAYALFAAGIIGVGLIALPILAGSVGYAVADTFDLSSGLSLRLLQAPGFYGVIAFSMVLGILLDLIGMNPMQALYLAAVVNGVAAPVLLAIIMLIGRNPHIMQEHMNGKFSTTIGWLTTVIMAVSAAAMLVSLVI